MNIPINSCVKNVEKHEIPPKKGMIQTDEVRFKWDEFNNNSNNNNNSFYENIVYRKKNIFILPPGEARTFFIKKRQNCFYAGFRV